MSKTVKLIKTDQQTEQQFKLLCDLIQAVKDYAYRHYEEDGWDYVVECWEDADLAAEIVGAQNKEEAVNKVLAVIRPMNDHRKDIEATAF